MPDVPTSPTERVSEWSPLREGLARVEDALYVVSSNVIAAAGQKPPKYDRAVRPITAADRARLRKRRMQHEEIVARVLPHKRPAAD